MAQYRDVLCVIPARAGSKGIVDKNLSYLGGYPLWEVTLKQALSSYLNPDQIVVSSDHPKILASALEKGVRTRLRPAQLSTDTSSTEEALIDAYINCSDRDWKNIMLLQVTSPIREKNLINRCLEKYFEGDYNSLHTVTKFYDFFWFKQDAWQATYNYQKRPMRQAIPPNELRYFENGNLYVTSVDILIKTKCRIGSKPWAFQISELEGMQIDTPEDLAIFRSVFNGSISDFCGLDG